MKVDLSCGGSGFVSLLTVAFIVLKITEHIEWSWVWVLSPIWISVALTVAILLLVGVVALMVYLITE